MHVKESKATTDILTAENLSFRYVEDDVWSDVSLSLHSGEVVSLVGGNGSGKSTLLRCLAGWTSPAEGEVSVFGKSFVGSNRAVRQEVAFVPDVPAFYDDLTALEHVQFVMAANRVPYEGSDAEALFDEFGLAEHAKQYPSAYSRGMRQKLALVIALMTKPRLLLLDEPYGPLDEDASVLLSAHLDRARKEGAAALVSCHHGMPQLTPDRVLRIANGTLREEPPSACDEDAR